MRFDLDAQDTPSQRPPSSSDSGYNWKGLLVQSFEFNMIEDGFRLASDDTLRQVTWTKPYWHDYIASLHQFNMRRWNDGDDFLVNYIGHPMQGAVTSFIEIQNSPTQARLEFGDPGYTMSRFKALLWSTAYSTYSEIGPTGEAGLGNEGGYTYGVSCQMHCNAQNFVPPNNKYTNNTGWVDFIITPTIGTLWSVGEDVIDKEIGKRFQEHTGGKRYAKAVRGALNPTRTFTNALRWRLPWYRDAEYGDDTVDGRYYAVHFVPDVPQVEWPRFQIAPHFTSLSTTITKEGCEYCRGTAIGAGVEVSYKLAGPFYADADISRQPSASPLPSDRAGGNMTTGFFGLRTGINTQNYALNIAVRPGFVQFDDAYETSPQPGEPTPEQGTITHFAWNFMLTTDYKLSKKFALRAGVGDTLVRYRQPCLDGSGVGLPPLLSWLDHGTSCTEDPGIGKPPYLSWLSHEDFINRGGVQVQLGPVFSF